MFVIILELLVWYAKCHYSMAISDAMDQNGAVGISDSMQHTNSVRINMLCSTDIPWALMMPHIIIISRASVMLWSKVIPAGTCKAIG